MSDRKTGRTGPVLIEIDGEPAPAPAAAPRRLTAGGQEEGRDEDEEERDFFLIPEQDLSPFER